MVANIIEPEDKRLEINDTVPKLVSMNTKIYVLLILSLVFNLMQGFWINSANQRAETNTELMFVKMYPNGSWDVEYRNTGQEMDFFPLTIDKLLQDYVEARFGVKPESIRRDYGFSLVFMSEALAMHFSGSGNGQYNAAKQAEALAKLGKTEEIKVRFVDHFDVANGVFVHGNSDVYRTNVFIERRIKNALGQQEGDPIKQVVNLHWRIKATADLKQSTRDELRANPIGLEIIREKINLDRSTVK